MTNPINYSHCGDPSCKGCNLIQRLKELGVPIGGVNQPEQPQKTQPAGFEGMRNALIADNIFIGGFGVDPAAPDDFDVPGYDRLRDVLLQAFNQAALGKGKDRHANDLVFEDQPMQTIAADHGIGFITGQARKKTEEALGMLQRGDHSAAVKEILGAMNYLAGAVIYIEDRSE